METELGLTEQSFTEGLAELIELATEEGISGLEVLSTSTFDDAGVMTYNKGLVVRMEDGSEFQLTVVRSK